MIPGITMYYFFLVSFPPLNKKLKKRTFLNWPAFIMATCNCFLHRTFQLLYVDDFYKNAFNMCTG